jgi:hypothetical protein
MRTVANQSGSWMQWRTWVSSTMRNPAISASWLVCFGPLTFSGTQTKGNLNNVIFFICYRNLTGSIALENEKQNFRGIVLSQICFRHHQKLSLNYQTRPDPKFLAVVNVTKLLCLDLSSSSLQKSHWRTAVLEYTTGPVLAGKKQYIFLRNGYRYNSMDIVVGSDSTFKAGLLCHLEGKILRYLLKMDCKF